MCRNQWSIHQSDLLYNYLLNLIKNQPILTLRIHPIENVAFISKMWNRQILFLSDASIELATLNFSLKKISKGRAVQRSKENFYSGFLLPRTNWKFPWTSRVANVSPFCFCFSCFLLIFVRVSSIKVLAARRTPEKKNEFFLKVFSENLEFLRFEFQNRFRKESPRFQPLDFGNRRLANREVHRFSWAQISERNCDFRWRAKSLKVKSNWTKPMSSIRKIRFRVFENPRLRSENKKKISIRVRSLNRLCSEKEKSKDFLFVEIQIFRHEFSSLQNLLDLIPSGKSVFTTIRIRVFLSFSVSDHNQISSADEIVQFRERIVFLRFPGYVVVHPRTESQSFSPDSVSGSLADTESSIHCDWLQWG